MQQDEFDRIKLVLSKGISQNETARIVNRSRVTIGYVYHSDTLEEYTEKMRNHGKKKAKKLFADAELIETKDDEVVATLKKILFRLDEIEEKVTFMHDHTEVKTSKWYRK